MSDVARNLLARYYGFGEKTDSNRTISIHECVSKAGSKDDVIVKQSSADLSEENASKQTEVEEHDVCSEKRTSFNDIYVRPTRLSESCTSLDEDAILDSTDSFLLPNVLDEGEIIECSSAKQDSPQSIKTPCKTLGPEEIGRNESSLTPIDDVLQDGASDISSAVVKKKSRKATEKLTVSLPPPPKRSPTCDGKFMDLTSLGLNKFPIDEIEKVTGLKMLYLEHNNLTELPEELFILLPQLEWLDVRNNQLAGLPMSVKSHRNLETVLLQGNNIERLPLELCFLPRLKILLVANNPLVIPPEDVVAHGCQSILNFLRNEWNRSHPEELVKPPEDDVGLKPSTILCYEPLLVNTKKRLQYKKWKGMNEFHNSSKGTTVRQKSRSYKPSSRCENRGTSIATDRHILWTSILKEMLNKQAAMLQKFKDESVRSKWRTDKRSFSTSMEKAARRNESDVPFAINTDYFSTSNSKSKSTQRSNVKRDFIPPANINKKIDELLESLNTFQISTRTLTPRSEQDTLKKEIEKILALQNEIQRLIRYNDVVMTSAKTEITD